MVRAGQNKEVITELEKELHEDAEDINLDRVDIQGLVSMFEKYEIEPFDSSCWTQRQIISSLIEKNSEPKIFIDVGQLIRRFKLWRKHLPSVEIFYALKSNHNPVIIEVLAQLGAGFDVASKGEISLIRSLGIPSEKMLFANPIKDTSHIAKAQAEDVNLMTFDGEDELLKIAQLHPQCQLLLRILVDDSGSTHRFGAKFGCRQDKIEDLLSLAQKLNLNLAGVSFHVGSGCRDPHSYSSAIRDARKVFETAHNYGFSMTILDIGGGFPGEDDKVTNEFFAKIAREINESLETYFGDVPDLRVISEPGRFFATSCGTVITSIIGRRSFTDEEGNKTFSYFVNSDVYGLFNNIIFDKAKIEIVPVKETRGKLYKSVIFGQTCDGADSIVNDIMLPEMFDSNWFYVPNHGAYTLASGSSSFNGFTMPEVKYTFSY
ncbi:MAG: type III PLP-dependent enzyme [Nitrososphaerales archaeon]